MHRPQIPRQKQDQYDEQDEPEQPAVVWRAPTGAASIEPTAAEEYDQDQQHNQHESTRSIPSCLRRDREWVVHFPAHGRWAKWCNGWASRAATPTLAAAL